MKCNNCEEVNGVYEDGGLCDSCLELKSHKHQMAEVIETHELTFSHGCVYAIEEVLLGGLHYFRKAQLDRYGYTSYSGMTESSYFAYRHWEFVSEEKFEYGHD